MLIGLISDTHDQMDGIEKAFQVFISKKVELILHAGDWSLPSTVEYIGKRALQANIPVKGVLGHSDKELESTLHTPTTYVGVEISTEKVMVMDINKKNIAIYHGDDERVVNNIIQEQIYDVLITGHTHRMLQERIDSTFIVNPGSTAFSQPITSNNVLSVVIYTLETNHCEVVYLTPEQTPPPANLTPVI